MSSADEVDHAQLCKLRDVFLRSTKQNFLTSRRIARMDAVEALEVS